MVFIKWLVIAAIVVVLAALAIGRAGLLQGRAPTDLGVREGRLQPPSATPNSVSSQAALYPGGHAEAQIAPLALVGSGPATIARIKAIVEAMPGATVVKNERGYLYVRFTTRWLRFVDDAEFWFDPAHGVIQVRSASRVGRRDFGVNRARIEAIRQRLEAG